MYRLSYKEIQTIQENTTRKLIKYINDFIKKNNSLDSIEFYYPDFDDENTMIAFNVWVSIDYRTNYGKTFIEHMLEEKSHGLTNLEREILRERNKSYVSLFEIQGIRGEFIYVLDILTGVKHKIWEPNLSTILKKSDLIFGRIGKIIEYEGFIGNISFLPQSAKDPFVEGVFIDYNRTRFKDSELTIEKYLKYYSVNLYKIYTECIYDVVEMNEDISSILYDELDEFESYLSLSLPRFQIKKHINNLVNLFEYYLMDEEMTLYDLNQINMEELINILIEDGFVNCQSELSSYIATLKKYLGFLKNKSSIYEEVFEEILEISKNIFIYINKIQYMEKPFNIDRSTSSKIANLLNEQAFDFIMDYEKFILYIMNKPMETTKKKKHIKRKNLLELNGIMENQEKIVKKAPNQIDFPMLNLFYIFSLDNELIKLNGDLLTSTKKSSQYIWLNDEDKYNLFLQYIWSDKFLTHINPSLHNEVLELVREDILALLSNLEEKVNYNYSKLFPKSWKYPDFLFTYYEYLEMIGLLKFNYYPKINISITPFGKAVFRILSEDNDDNNNGKTISLLEYKKNR